MKKVITLFGSSYLEFTKTKTITTCALFGALAIILGVFSIQIGDFIKIGFSNLPNEAIAYLFGPAVAPFFGGAMDLLKYLVRPTGAFFPGFTISAAAAGLINGLMLYQRPLTLKRVFAAKLIIILSCDLLLNTWWLSILYGSGFLALLPMRFIKCMIMWPIEAGLMYSVMKTMEATGLSRQLGGSKKVSV